MLAFPVVKNLDVFKGLSLDHGVSRKASAMHPLILEAVEPALRRRVVPAVALPAHGADHAVGSVLFLKGMTGVLAAPVGLVQQPGCRTFPEPGHGQCPSRCPPSCAASTTNQRLHG